MNDDKELDEILDIPNIVRMVREKGGSTLDIDKHIQLTKSCNLRTI